MNKTPFQRRQALRVIEGGIAQNQVPNQSARPVKPSALKDEEWQVMQELAASHGKAIQALEKEFKDIALQLYQNKTPDERIRPTALATLQARYRPSPSVNWFGEDSPFAEKPGHNC